LQPSNFDAATGRFGNRTDTLLNPETFDKSVSFPRISPDGRWIVFSSRRMDGLHTCLYFAYFDTAGRIHKPFVLPQKNPDFYRVFLKSYNVPEFINEKVELNPYDIIRTLDGEITVE